jgi:hypothetical protein
LTEPQDLSLAEIRNAFGRLGASVLLAKALAPNDNSKNQIYLGGDFQALGILPVGQVRADTSPDGREILKATVRFSWLQIDGTSTEAPNAQLILYPQYPEVRLSGILLGSRKAPSQLIASREDGRILLLAVTSDGSITAVAAGPASQLARDIAELKNLETAGIFLKIPLTRKAVQPKEQLLSELRRIHTKGWIDGRALRRDGSVHPCNSQNCIGFTLEAELGVARNGYSEPDFLGWEVKAAQARDLFTIPISKAVTLLTPEPDLGFYCQNGASDFVRRYGYTDRRQREDRLNFGGVFANGRRQSLTGLTLGIAGFDATARKMVTAHGAIELRSDDGTLAAGWSFAKLTKHWNRKHAQAVYVPALCNTNGLRRYQYGGVVTLGEGTDFLLFLSAVARGSVYYDPALKIENASNPASPTKRRSQFRIKAGNLTDLYRTMTQVNLLA